MKYTDILFDLDGTLTDPGLGITNSVIYALKRYGITVSDRTELYKFIGPPLWASFSEYYGFSKEEAERAVEVYREYFAEKGLYENEVYPGIEDMLKALNEKGARIYLATSKPEVFAKKILEHFGLDRYFHDIAGSELNGERVEKAEVIECLLKRNNIGNAIMVGDRSFDILGAKENTIPAVGVLYGYGTKDELTKAGAKRLIKSVKELKEYLIK